jgi:transcriptional regulator with XRE-family HTH domain
MEINQIIASRLSELRSERGLTLAALAERSGVSRSNISLIERGESSATATVLDKLTTALGVPLASLFDQPSTVPLPLARFADQPIWTDPASGYVRRNLSPRVYSPIQMVEVNFPPRQRVAYETSTRSIDIYQQVWIIEGTMEITVGETLWRLETGDCLSMQLDKPIAFHNPADQPARYLVSLATYAHKSLKRED